MPIVIVVLSAFLPAAVADLPPEARAICSRIVAYEGIFSNVCIEVKTKNPYAEEQRRKGFAPYLFSEIVYYQLPLKRYLKRERIYEDGHRQVTISVTNGT